MGGQRRDASELIVAGVHKERSWWRDPVVIATVLALAIRFAAVLSRSGLQAHGDAYFYHEEANVLVAGKGWINPFFYDHVSGHPHIATASFPPLFTILLAAVSLVGLKSFLAQRLWCAVIGAAAVPLGAWVGRDFGGRRVAVLAAFGIAIYPNLWMSDELGMSESLTPILVLVVLAAAYRLWRDPTPARAGVLGLALGAAALGRDELALLVPLVLVPLALTRNVPLGRRIRMLVAGVGIATLVVGPWVAYNMSRFSKPVFISDGLGVTLASANCDSTWNGTSIGYWSMACAAAVPVNRVGDESVQGAEDQHYAVSYIDDHLGSLPRVEAARLGRAFGLYRVIQQAQYDTFIDGRPKAWVYVGMIMYYALALLSLPGAVILRRRGITILPLVAILIDVSASVLLTFGQTRYRVSLEPVLVLLAAVAVDRWLLPRRSVVSDLSDHQVVSGVEGRDTLIVVPALDEERTVAGVVRRVRDALPDAGVLVVDDGSSDATAVLARAAGADVAVSPFNLGVGGAMRIGFRFAAAHGYRAVVQVDADGQHEPSNLPRLLAALDSGPRPHVVIGCRFGSGYDVPTDMSVPWPRRIAMRSLAAYVSHRTGSRLDDVTSGFRAHNRAAIELFARSYPAEYLSDTVESLIIAHQAGARLDQIPVQMHARAAGQPSQSTLKSITYLARVSLILVLGVIRSSPKSDVTKGSTCPVSI